MVDRGDGKKVRYLRSTWFTTPCKPRAKTTTTTTGSGETPRRVSRVQEEILMEEARKFVHELKNEKSKD